MELVGRTICSRKCKLIFYSFDPFPSIGVAFIIVIVDFYKM
jgi:hypothetical protein